MIARHGAVTRRALLVTGASLLPIGRAIGKPREGRIVSARHSVDACAAADAQIGRLIATTF